MKNSLLPTRNDLVAKLPTQIEGIEKETLEEVLTQIYRKAVESRGIEFQDITDTEVGAKIQKAAEWMMGNPVRSGLLFQGTIGSGKTTLMYAMYGLYKQFASPVITPRLMTCTPSSSTSWRRRLPATRNSSGRSTSSSMSSARNRRDARAMVRITHPFRI